MEFSVLKEHSKKIIFSLILVNAFSLFGSLIVFYTNQFYVFRNIVGFFIVVTLILNYFAGHTLTSITNRGTLKGRFLNTMFDLYILYSIFAYASLFGVTFLRVFRTIIGFLSLFAIVILFSILIYRWKDSEAFMDPNSSDYPKIKVQKIEVIFKRVLIFILIFLYLLAFSLLGTYIFQISHAVSAGTGMGLTAATMYIYLIFLGISQIPLRIFPKAEKPKIHRGIFIGIGLITVLFMFPVCSIPVSIQIANRDFRNAFGDDWNRIPEQYKDSFLGSPFDLSSPYFGIRIDEKFNVIQGIMYKNSTNYTLYYDVHVPKQSGVGQNRTIIYLHGGGWTSGSRSNAPDLKAYFANQGYVVFSIDYRLVDTALLAIKEEIGLNLSAKSAEETRYLSGPYGIRDMIQDIGDFTHHIASIPWAYGANLSAVCFLGQSAGGYLAAIAALGYKNPWFGSIFNQNLSVESLVLYYPPDDAESFFYNSHPFYTARFKMINGTPETNPEEFFYFTPSNLVGSESPPCLLLHGTMDTLVPYENSLRILQKYREFNRPLILITYYFIGHAFTHNPQYQPINVFYIERFLYNVHKTQ